MEDGLISALDIFRGCDTPALLVKIVAAVLMGGLIGLERRRKRRPAGFRTHILVCVGAVLAMCTNLYLVQLFDTLFPEGYSRLDASRLGAQVINGIGFLGAGTILVTGRQQVKGLTTAAGLWASACMGLAIGAGYFELAVFSCAAIYASITVLNNVEKVFTDRSCNMNLSIVLTDTTRILAVTETLKGLGVHIFDTEITNSRNLQLETPCLVMELRLPKRGMHSGTIAAVAGVDGVIAVEEV